MEGKLNLIKTLLNSIITRWKIQEKLDLEAKGIYEELINMQDQSNAISNEKQQQNLFIQEINELALLKINIESQKLITQLEKNNQLYVQFQQQSFPQQETYLQIKETIINLEKVLNNQKQNSSKAGQLSLLLFRINEILDSQQLHMNMRQQLINNENFRYSLLNYLHKPLFDDYNTITDLLIQF